MGLLDKLQFWKHRETEDFDIGKYPALTDGPAPTAMPGMAPPGMMDFPGGTPHAGMPGENAPSMPGLDDISQVPPPPLRGLGGQPAPSAFAPAPVSSLPSGPDMGREMQVVNAKLDTLKALLDSINIKLDRMERVQPKEEVEIIPLQRRFR